MLAARLEFVFAEDVLLLSTHRKMTMWSCVGALCLLWICLAPVFSHKETIHSLQQDRRCCKDIFVASRVRCPAFV